MELMSYFGTQLELHLQAKQMTPYQLAKLAGVGSSHLYNVVTGKRRPTDDLIEQLAAVPEAELDEDILKFWRSVDESTNGDVDRFLNAIKNDPKTLSKFSVVFKSGDILSVPVFAPKALDESLNNPHHGLEYINNSSVTTSGELRPVQTIPIIGVINSAGYKSVTDLEESLGVTFWPGAAAPKNAVAIKIQGDMMQPVIPSGGEVICLPVKGRLKSGKVYILENLQEDPAVRMVRLSEDGVILEPINPMHRAIAMKKATYTRAWEVLSYHVWIS